MVETTRHDPYQIARKRMIQEQLVARGINDSDVLEVMGKIPRHIFVDEALKSQAYIDAPLNIGEGQTISQPFIVALMTQALELTGKEKVLEIGTGCGYQTAVLGLLAKQVYTIERHKSLTMQARRRLKRLGIKNIVMRVGDGSLGWTKAAPFDRILIACASPKLPENLLNQLKVGGFILVPVDAEPGVQDLLKIIKTESGFETKSYGACRFVKMIGKHGYEK